MFEIQGKETESERNKLQMFGKEKMEALALSEGVRKKILIKQQTRGKLKKKRKVMEPVTKL